MKTLSLATLVAAPFAFLPVDAPAGAQNRSVRCVVRFQGSPTYTGRCHFMPEENGDFVITPVRGREFPTGATGIGLYIERRGVADVQRLTPTGPATSIGTAVRSRRDRACWVGERFSICAY